ERFLQIEVERLAEDPWLRTFGALSASARGPTGVAAEGVAAQAGEETIEDLLPDPPAPSRSELQAAADALGVPSLLERPSQLLESRHVLGRFVVEQTANLVKVEVGERGRVVRAAQLRPEPLEGL